MPAKPNQVPKMFARMLQEAVDAKCKKTSLDTLVYIGNKCVSIARDKDMGGNYTDQTGNLRGSIGFVVAKNGEILYSSAFEPVQGKDGTLGTEGPALGKQFAEQLAMEQPSGKMVLVFVAGMNYASPVEARGRNVIASAYLFALEIVSNMRRAA